MNNKYNDYIAYDFRVFAHRYICYLGKVSSTYLKDNDIYTLTNDMIDLLIREITYLRDIKNQKLK